MWLDSSVSYHLRHNGCVWIFRLGRLEQRATSFNVCVTSHHLHIASFFSSPLVRHQRRHCWECPSYSPVHPTHQNSMVKTSAPSAQIPRLAFCLDHILECQPKKKKQTESDLFIQNPVLKSCKNTPLFVFLSTFAHLLTGVKGSICVVRPENKNLARDS